MGKNTAVCLIVLLPLFTAAISTEHIASGAMSLDSFLSRTGTRVAECWNLAHFEFKLAFQHLGDQHVYVERDVKSRADIAVETAVDTVKTQVREGIENTVNDVKTQVRDGVGKAVKETIEEKTECLTNGTVEDESGAQQ